MQSRRTWLLGFWASPFAQRVKWALKLKGVSHEYINEDLVNKSSLLLKLNPVHEGKVPVLVHNQKPISESLVILEYVDEVWESDPPLLPLDPYERAQARFWAKFVEEKIRKSAFEALCSSTADAREIAVKSCTEALEKIEEQIEQLKLKGKNFFGGETIGFLDLAAASIAYELPVFEEISSIKILDPSKFPSTIDWINNFLNHPLIKDDLPPKEELIAYFNNHCKEI